LLQTGTFYFALLGTSHIAATKCAIDPGGNEKYCYTLVLVCPKCGSNYLVIRQRVGLELLLMRFTDKRKYMCLGCKTTFRAPDRRRAPRAPEDAPRSLLKKD
jgi:DNA-directed RNA polymerase subunit RPC12/RpoP